MHLYQKHGLLHPWSLIISRFTTVDDYNWFTKTMLRVATEEFGETTAQLVEPTGYFVDFMRYDQWMCRPGNSIALEYDTDVYFILACLVPSCTLWWQLILWSVLLLFLSVVWLWYLVPVCVYFINICFVCRLSFILCLCMHIYLLLFGLFVFIFYTAHSLFSMTNLKISCMIYKQVITAWS